MKQILLENRKARFNYEILETYEAGIELLGFEVKALKNSRGDITAGHIIIRGNEAFAVNIVIPPYQPSNTPTDYQSDRTRRLLLKSKEIKELTGKIHKTGLTLVLLKVYTKGRLVKMLVGLAKGKNKGDKREAIIKREWSRLRRNIKN